MDYQSIASAHFGLARGTRVRILAPISQLERDLVTGNSNAVYMVLRFDGTCAMKAVCADEHGNEHHLIPEALRAI